MEKKTVETSTQTNKKQTNEYRIMREMKTNMTTSMISTDNNGLYVVVVAVVLSTFLFFVFFWMI